MAKTNPEFGVISPEVLKDSVASNKKAPAIMVMKIGEFLKGHWIYRLEGTYRRTRCYCSVCGKHSGIGGTRENQAKPYCPNCGARMDGDPVDETR